MLYAFSTPSMSSVYICSLVITVSEAKTVCASASTVLSTRPAAAIHTSLNLLPVMSSSFLCTSSIVAATLPISCICPSSIALVWCSLDTCATTTKPFVLFLNPTVPTMLLVPMSSPNTSCSGTPSIFTLPACLELSAIRTSIYTFSICQSIGSNPFSLRKSLVLLKCLHPKNPLYADSGLGCGAFSIRCLGFVSIGILLCAGFPHSR